MIERAMLIAALLLPQRLVGQSCTPQDPDVRALLQLEDGWASGVVRRDTVAFGRLLDPGFVYTENDQVMSRADVLQGVAAGSDTVTAAHNEGMVVHCFGTTSVVTGWLVLEGHGGGAPFLRRYRFTDTWIKKDGGWRIVAAEDYLAPKP